MIETRTTTVTRLEIDAAGIVDAGDVRRAVAAIGDALADGGRLTLLIDLSGVEDITVKAFGGDLAGSGALVGRLGGLERVAVVGDASWLRALTRLQAALPAPLKVRFFDVDALGDARGWLGGDAPADGDASISTGGASGGGGATPDRGAGAEPKARPDPRPSEPPLSEPSPSGPSPSGPSPGAARRPGLRLVDGDDPGLFTLEIEGRIRRDDVEAMAARLDELQGGSARIRLLGRVRSFDGFEPAVLLSPALWRLQREGLGRVSRFALVTSVDWLGRLLESAGRMQRVETRTFAADDEAAARAWLDGAPVD